MSVGDFNEHSGFGMGATNNMNMGGMSSMSMGGMPSYNQHSNNYRGSRKNTLIYICVIIGVLICGFCMAQNSANQAIDKEELVEQAKADVATQIDRKVNLFNELADVVKQYDTYEYNTLMQIIAARVDGSTNGVLDDISTQEVLNIVNAVAEAYPELKSQANYEMLMTNISETENLLANHKKAYNNAVKNYRSYCRKFPTRWFLSFSGYDVVDYDQYSTNNSDGAFSFSW